MATVVFTGLESAAGLSGEVTASRAALKRLIGSATGVVMVVYVGIAPGRDDGAAGRRRQRRRSAGDYLEAPMLGIAEAFDTDWLATV